MCQRLLSDQAASYLCPQDADTLAVAKYTAVIFVSTLCVSPLENKKTGRELGM